MRNPIAHAVKKPQCVFLLKGRERKRKMRNRKRKNSAGAVKSYKVPRATCVFGCERNRIRETDSQFAVSGAAASTASTGARRSLVVLFSHA